MTDLQRELPLALRNAYLAMHRATDSCFAPYGVTADQFVLLLALSCGEALTQRELSSRIGSDPSTVRAMLVLLERAALIERSTHPSDGRAKTVALSAAGRVKVKQLWALSQSIRDRMQTALGSIESSTLVGYLNQLANELAPHPQSSPHPSPLV
ncbi:MAG: MarR family transcriptional regulator [Pirellula sp.]|jgi:DNA-binding MarR family transcriptional regulator|nr:MarR family transcriptional regulator [Pirellula sp.]